MPARFEEINVNNASCQFVTAEELEDITGVGSAEPAAIILWYDEAVVLTGSADEIRALLQSAMRVLDAAGGKTMPEDREVA